MTGHHQPIQLHDSEHRLAAALRLLQRWSPGLVLRDLLDAAFQLVLLDLHLALEVLVPDLVEDFQARHLGSVAHLASQVAVGLLVDLVNSTYLEHKIRLANILQLASLPLDSCLQVLVDHQVLVPLPVSLVAADPRGSAAGRECIFWFLTTLEGTQSNYHMRSAKRSSGNSASWLRDVNQTAER